MGGFPHWQPARMELDAGCCLDSYLLLLVNYSLRAFLGAPTRIASIFSILGRLSRHVDCSSRMILYFRFGNLVAPGGLGAAIRTLPGSTAAPAALCAASHSFPSWFYRDSGSHAGTNHPAGIGSAAFGLAIRSHLSHLFSGVSSRFAGLTRSPRLQ